MRDAWSACVEFNNSYPIGTKLLFKSKQVTVASEASSLPNGEPIVTVEELTFPIRLTELSNVPDNV